MRSEHRRTFGAMALLLTTSLFVACNPTPGEGFFDAENFVYGTCTKEILPWEPGFFTIDKFDNTITIRLQDRGGSIDGLVDGIFITLDRAYIEANLRQPILLGLPDDSGQVRARAIMGFFKTCPRSEVTPEMLGTIRFLRFEPEGDGQITAELDAPTVIDSRTGDRLGVNLVGEFNFVVQLGRPYTNFTGPGNQ